MTELVDSDKVTAIKFRIESDFITATCIIKRWVPGAIGDWTRPAKQASWFIVISERAISPSPEDSSVWGKYVWDGYSYTLIETSAFENAKKWVIGQK